MIDALDRPGATLTRGRMLVLVSLLALLVDLNSLPGAFIADDYPIVVDNPSVTQFDPGRIFTADYWGQAHADKLYRPLTILSFALNHLAFGPGPLSFHLVNVLLHAGTVCFFALTLLGLGFAPVVAAAASALFAIHPIHTDVVNVVVGRAELLVACLVFAGLWLALTRGRRAWPLVLGCYLAALLSKEHAVVFLPLLALADAFVKGRARGNRDFWRERVLLYALLSAITVCWLLLRAWVFHAAAGPSLLIYATDNPLVGANLIVRALTALKVNLLYLANLLLPLRLHSLYSGRYLQVVGDPFSGWGLVSVGYFLLCGAATIHGWRRRAGYGFGIPLFFIGFAVTANLFFLITVLMADRFAYLPSAGFSLALASVLLLPAQRASTSRAARALLLLPVGYALFLVLLTLGRNDTFQDPAGFWRSVTRSDPGNVRAWYFLAQASQQGGNIREAERALLESIRADPSFPDAHIAYSLLLLEQGKPAESATSARRAIEAAPRGVGLAQFALAKADVQLGRAAEALDLLGEVSTMFSETPEYWNTLGRSLEALDRPLEAIEAFRSGLAIADHPETRWRLARLLLQTGRHRESEEVLLTLLAREKTAQAYNLLGVSLAAQQRYDEAERAFHAAIKLDPDSARYNDNREKALQRLRPAVP